VFAYENQNENDFTGLESSSDDAGQSNGKKAKEATASLLRPRNHKMLAEPVSSQGTPRPDGGFKLLSSLSAIRSSQYDDRRICCLLPSSSQNRQ